MLRWEMWHLDAIKVPTVGILLVLSPPPAMGVPSVLDSWEPDQAWRMACSGNGKARKFFKAQGVQELGASAKDGREEGSEEAAAPLVRGESDR